MLNKLSRGRTLTFLLGMAIAFTISFGVIAKLSDIRFLDGMAMPGEVLDYVGTLTSKQKMIHSVVTGSLDVLYPLTYGALLAGVVLRYMDDPHPAWLLPAVLVIPVDLVEGVIQIMILNGGVHLVGWKFWLTTVKFVLFFMAVAIAVFAMGGSFVTRFAESRKS